MKFPVVCILFVMIATGCASIKQNPADGFKDGYYTLPAGQYYYMAQADSFNLQAPQKLKVFVYTNTDTLFITSHSNSDTADRLYDSRAFVYPFAGNHGSRSLKLRESSLDFDLFTTPFKARRAIENLPPQITTNFNASAYLGYRIDKYTISKERLNKYFSTNRTNRIGFGAGVFLGLGAATITPDYIHNAQIYEYEAAIINYGIALLVGHKQFNTGLAFGVDYLTDENKNNWVYQNKPWLGIFIGLNLN